MGLSTATALKRAMVATTTYDVVVIGAGPAGLQAAIHASSDDRSTLVIEKSRIGGQIAGSARVENFNGWDASGKTITNHMKRQAEHFGATFVHGEAVKLEEAGHCKRVTLADGSTVNARTVVLALGLQANELPIEGPHELFGHDVIYGSVLDKARAAKGKVVGIVGGGNSVGQLAVYASAYASRVFLFVRSDDFRSSMVAYLADRIESIRNIHVVTGARVTAVTECNHRLKTVRYHVDGEDVSEPVSTLFVCIGSSPHTDWLPDQINRDDHGYIVCDGLLPFETAMRGVFAIGDANVGLPARGASSAVGQGAEATRSVRDYLDSEAMFGG